MRKPRFDAAFFCLRFGEEKLSTLHGAGNSPDFKVANVVIAQRADFDCTAQQPSISLLLKEAIH